LGPKNEIEGDYVYFFFTKRIEFISLTTTKLLQTKLIQEIEDRDAQETKDKDFDEIDEV